LWRARGLCCDVAGPRRSGDGFWDAGTVPTYHVLRLRTWGSTARGGGLEAELPGVGRRVGRLGGRNGAFLDCRGCGVGDA